MNLESTEALPEIEKLFSAYVTVGIFNRDENIVMVSIWAGVVSVYAAYEVAAVAVGDADVDVVEL